MKNHLCSGKEDVVRYVANPTRDDTQSHPGKHVGVVALPRVEGAPVSQGHLVEGASAGKDAPALMREGGEIQDKQTNKKREQSFHKVRHKELN